MIFIFPRPCSTQCAISAVFEEIQTPLVVGRDVVGSHSGHRRCPVVCHSEMEQPWEKARVHPKNPPWPCTDNASAYVAGSIDLKTFPSKKITLKGRFPPSPFAGLLPFQSTGSVWVHTQMRLCSVMHKFVPFRDSLVNLFLHILLMLLQNMSHC